ncbi:MAG: sugar nucleotide-binding protein, partial [Microcystaceae cyanobacterium]
IPQVIPITTPEYPTPAQRPVYSVLSGQKIATILGTHASHWRESLRQMLKQLHEFRIQNSERRLKVKS